MRGSRKREGASLMFSDAGIKISSLSLEQEKQEDQSNRSTGDIDARDIVVRIQALSKCYQIYDKPHDRLKQSLYPRLQTLIGKSSKKYHREFWALNKISFEIRKGETVGIVGRNGSGKSTLLQIICGTLAPSDGAVETNGRIAALLELGSGFNPEFTGRENVFMNGSVLGLSKEEIDQRYDAIVSFADIGQFIDQPVKTYSSGMVVRLAFAVQAQLDPDILIVDEALSVGDARFQAKCFERLRQLKENGTSILLVTHSSEQIVTHCDRAILLDSGKIEQMGTPRQVVNRYMDLLFGRDRLESTNAHRLQNTESISPHDVLLDCRQDVFSGRPGYNPNEYRWGDGAATWLDYHIETNGVAFPASFELGDRVSIKASCRFNARVVNPIIGLTIKTKEGVTVFNTNSALLDSDGINSSGVEGSVITVDMSFVIRLSAGDYFTSIGLASRHGEDVIPHDRRYDVIHFIVAPSAHFSGLVDLEAKMIIGPVRK